MFRERLLQVIKENFENNYMDNFDFFRFGQPERDIIKAEEALPQITPYLPKINSFYDLLEDQRSKELLVWITAYRILGHRKIKLPLSLPELDESLELIDGILDKTNNLHTGYRDWKLYYGNLNPIDIPLNLYTLPGPVLSSFFLKQYEYAINENDFIKTEEGETVIDAGGCWGDTAFYFALETGSKGKVYSFEFLPKNVEIMRKNISMNPKFEKVIEVIDKPLWEKSDIPVYFFDNGPGSRVSFNKLPEYNGEVSTVSIDDFVDQKRIDRIDFIKMDIESAELFALKGALKTINKFKPKMAISVYHGLEDFVNIIHYINELGLEYKFYLGHFTIQYEETVLYCKI